jgi:HPt (histidine-containing phosphotransfer) domain-containing protein
MTSNPPGNLIAAPAEGQASGPMASKAPGLDPGAIARLQELDPDGRHGVVNRVLAAYETSLTRTLAQLQAEREGGNPAVVARLAHTLKSSSASVGALGFAAACAKVEAKLLTGVADELGQDVDRLLAEGQAAMAAVGAMLQGNARHR